jgi:hypothetical protein
MKRKNIITAAITALFTIGCITAVSADKINNSKITTIQLANTNGPQEVDVICIDHYKFYTFKKDKTPISTIQVFEGYGEKNLPARCD